MAYTDANWDSNSHPKNTSTYTQVLQLLRDREENIARQFCDISDSDNTLGTNHINGTIRWGGTKWLIKNTSGTWEDLVNRYSIDVNTVEGCAPSDLSGSNSLARNNGNVQANLNADQLDGQHGGYYRNAANLNTGTISDSRLPDTISSNISGVASNVKCTATNSTNETVYPIFVDEATGGQGVETDTGFTYNPSTGTLSTGGAAITNDTSASSTSTGALTVVGGISTQENIHVGGTLVESSARHLKENIKKLPKQLSNILKLNPVSYNKKATGLKELGLIADEVQEIYPDLVTKNAEGINYSRLTVLLVSSIKELKEIIDTQNTKISDLEARISYP